MDFLEFEVGTDIVGDMIETAEVGSNTGLKGEVFIEAIASTKSHCLFGVITTDSSGDVELANAVRLEETVKSSLSSEALLHLVVELVNTGIDGREVVLHFSVIRRDGILIGFDVGLIRGDVSLVRGDVGLVRGDQLVLSQIGRLKTGDLLVLNIVGTIGKISLFVDLVNVGLVLIDTSIKVFEVFLNLRNCKTITRSVSPPDVVS